ncbi:MAG: alpha/beta hydrolase, partial [Mycobacterium sp.]
MEPGPMPDGVTATVTTVKTADDASAPGILYTVARATTAVTLMHPRQDLARHHLIPTLLEAGFAVWAQGSRTVNNDLTLIHEEAVLDAAAGFEFLRDRGFEHIVACGPSGGAALYAFYVQQASRRSEDRIRMTPGGKPIPLDKAVIPVPDAVIFVAAHPGQGELLLGCIDGAVADEADPLSTVPELDIFNEANGFREPPTCSQYSPEFLGRYREAQRARVARIDAHARHLIAERMDAKERFKASKRAADRRASVMSKVITVYRTDADPRTLDLSLDPSDRPYGSIHGRRPDLI